MTIFGAKQLIGICAHLGNHKYNWNPETERFAIGYRNSVIIFNLSITNFYANKAINFVERLIIKFGRLFVYGLFSQTDQILTRRLAQCGQVISLFRWKGGFITNTKVFSKIIKNTKKKFAAAFSLRYDYQNYSFPVECRNLSIPSICVVDSDVSLNNFSYPIPMNSKSYGGAKVLGYYILSTIFKSVSTRIITRFSRKIRFLNGKKVKRLYYKRSRRIAIRRSARKLYRIFRRGRRLLFKDKKKRFKLRKNYNKKKFFRKKKRKVIKFLQVKKKLRFIFKKRQKKMLLLLKKKFKRYKRKNRVKKAKKRLKNFKPIKRILIRFRLSVIRGKLRSRRLEARIRIMKKGKHYHNKKKIFSKKTFQRKHFQ